MPDFPRLHIVVRGDGIGGEGATMEGTRQHYIILQCRGKQNSKKLNIVVVAEAAAMSQEKQRRRQWSRMLGSSGSCTTSGAAAAAAGVLHARHNKQETIGASLIARGWYSTVVIALVLST